MSSTTIIILYSSSFSFKIFTSFISVNCILLTLPDLWSGILKLNAALVLGKISLTVTFVDTCEKESLKYFKSVKFMQQKIHHKCKSWVMSSFLKQYHEYGLYCKQYMKHHKNLFQGQNLPSYIRIGINFHIHRGFPTLVQGIYVTNKYLIPLQTCSCKSLP